MLGLTPSAIDAILLSVQVAVWCTLLVLPVATFFAYVLARFEFPGKVLLDAAIHLPLVLPPVVTGYALLILLGRNGVIGGFLADELGIVFAFRWTGAVIASAVMALPLSVRAIRVALEGVDPLYERAAKSLGTNRLTVLLRVTLPLAMPGLVAGAIFAFAKSLGEFGATITFVANIPGETQTIPSAIYSLLQAPGGEAEALILSGIAGILALLSLVAAELFVRYQRGRETRALSQQRNRI
ncbi:MAG: molybdate ABC transporter permease subunit [Alphaproteobacteria bacterium]|nr:molybdate ABC transporter permease subunit [Alphaproteobacteria bacterium]